MEKGFPRSPDLANLCLETFSSMFVVDNVGRYLDICVPSLNIPQMLRVYLCTPLFRSEVAGVMRALTFTRRPGQVSAPLQ